MGSTKKRDPRTSPLRYDEKDYGYTPDQTIKGGKSIDNWFNGHNNGKTDWDKLHKSFMEFPKRGLIIIDNQRRSGPTEV